MPTYTRTETVEAWQWNGFDDNRGVVHCHPASTSGWLETVDGFTIIDFGKWIIKRGNKYKVITDAKFKAQGWKEVVDDEG